MLQTLNEAYKVLQLQGYRLRHMKRFTWPRSAERNLWALRFDWQLFTWQRG